MLVELGSGLAERTRTILESFRRRGSLDRFLTVDVDGILLEFAAAELAIRYPELQVHGILGDLWTDLSALDISGRKLVLLLGSTLGILQPSERSALLSQLSASLEQGDWFLVGVDLVKPVEVVEAAYNDSVGISAAFNLNMLSVLNSRLGGDFDLDGFKHVARFNTHTEQMEMSLLSVRQQNVRLDAVDLTVEFEEAELLHTQISTKFRQDGIEAELRSSGLEPRQWWTDSGGNFAVSLSSKPY